jgi:hypothetical protein
MSTNFYLRKRLTPKTLRDIRARLATRFHKLNEEPSCDFCGSIEPKFVYAATRMSSGAPIETWRWCACDDCAEAIESHNWGKIENKIVDLLLSRFKNAARDLMATVAQQALKEFHQYAKPIKKQRVQ